jgi:hypothetical protein
LRAHLFVFGEVSSATERGAPSSAPRFSARKVGNHPGVHWDPDLPSRVRSEVADRFCKLTGLPKKEG